MCRSCNCFPFVFETRTPNPFNIVLGQRFQYLCTAFENGSVFSILVRGTLNHSGLTINYFEIAGIDFVFGNLETLWDSTLVILDNV
jgi:hypothetical protein